MDVRLICATNVDLEKEITEHKFRHDLFHRIARFAINLPALRDRTEDIMPLADFFLENSSRELNKEYLKFSTEVVDLMMSYSWPGNIRELANAVDSAVIVAKGEEISVDDIEPRVLRTFEMRAPLKERLIDISKATIIDALEKSKGNVTKAAQNLKVYRYTLQRLIKKFNIKTKQYKK